MDTQKASLPFIERGLTKIWVRHNAGKIAFASPSVGPTNYRNAGAQIIKANQQVPHGDSTASLLHAAYCSEALNEPEFVNVRDIMTNRWLGVFNRNLWNENGVYVLQDIDATGLSKPLRVEELEARLKGGRELGFGGIRLSQDGEVRFAPKGSYRLGEHTSESFGKDGFIIASCGEEGAKKSGEVSAKFGNPPYIYGVEVKEGKTPEQRVSAVGEDDLRFRFDGDWGGYDYDGRAFGVLK